MLKVHIKMSLKKIIEWIKESDVKGIDSNENGIVLETMFIKENSKILSIFQNGHNVDESKIVIQSPFDC